MSQKAFILIACLALSPNAATAAETADDEADCWLVDNHVWWSPDMSRLVLYSACNTFAGAQIVTLDPDGGDAVDLTHNRGSNHSPEWSPDGTKIAFYSDMHSPDADELYGPFDIYVMNADGSGVERLTDAPGRDGGPVWSPDGTKIAFYSNRDGDTEIYLMNADGSDQTRLTSHDGWDWPMGWSRADGRLVAYGMRGGSLDIYTLNPDGTDIRYLTDSDADEEQPAYSPDGKEIIYYVTEPDRARLMVMKADGSGKRVIAESDTYVFDQPTFSPDGRRIGYSIGNRGAEGVERYWRTVIIANLDGSHPHILRGEVHE